jgi:hypothetical protein
MPMESRFAVRLLCSVFALAGIAAVFCSGLPAQQENRKQFPAPGPMLIEGNG